MRWLEVKQRGPLDGSVIIPGSKNSSLALIAAAVLGDTPTILEGIPDINDIRAIGEIGSRIGLQVSKNDDGHFVVDSSRIHSSVLDQALTSSFRASYYLIGGLLSKYKRVTLGYPGGDNFVERPIDQHMKIFKAFGADVTLEEKQYTVSAEKLTGTDFCFDLLTSGATINAVLLASLAAGITHLHNCATDPEVVDVCQLLNRMGADITGAGTDTIRIRGVKSLTGCRYRVIPDRLIAGAFMMTVGITGGTLTLKQVIPEHVRSIMAKLSEIGIEFESGNDYIIASSQGNIKPTRVRTGMYPVFNSDMQQPITSLLLKAPGYSAVREKVYPYRFSHVAQLNRLGADIQAKNGYAIIKGGRPLHGGYAHATDVRAGTCLIMAGLQSEQATRITGIEHIERGYEDAVHLFGQAGIGLVVHEGEPAPDGTEYTTTA
jgi:UDP-N-acetylglucosamine 1-carboxyvinyltransferase